MHSATSLGACSKCFIYTVVSAQGLCFECVAHYRSLRRLQREREKLLSFGLEEAPAPAPAPSYLPPTHGTQIRSVPPLFILCVAYLSNNTDLMEQEAIDYLPSEVRYFLFLLELSNKRTKDSSTSTSSAAPRLRLAKRFLASSRVSSGPHHSSFGGFDFSALQARTCLNPAQIENVFDYLTSFGRPSIEGLRTLSLKGLSFVNDASLKTIAAQMRLLRVLDLSFCDNISDEGVSALLPRLKLTEARNSWEELASDDAEEETEDDTLLRGLSHLRQLGIYGCGKLLTRAILRTLRMAYAGRPALTVYTSLLFREEDRLNDEHRDVQYIDPQVAVGVLEVEAAQWRAVTKGVNNCAAAADQEEWTADDTKQMTLHAEEERAVERRILGGGDGGGDDDDQGDRMVVFVNDILPWNVVEEASYALRCWQIEEIDDLRRRCYVVVHHPGVSTAVTRRKPRLPSLNTHWHYY